MLAIRVLVGVRGAIQLQISQLEKIEGVQFRRDIEFPLKKVAEFTFNEVDCGCGEQRKEDWKIGVDERRIVKHLLGEQKGADKQNAPV